MKGDVFVLLNENWQATLYENGVVRYVVPAKVPGCIHADLQRAGIIGDFFCRDNADGIFASLAEGNKFGRFFSAKPVSFTVSAIRASAESSGVLL